MNLFSILTDINAAMDVGTTLPVKIWMGWMSLVFLASAVFMFRHKPARWVFIAMLATMAAVLYIWSLTKNVHLFGVAHILIWFPLSFFIWNNALSQKVREKQKHHKAYYIWAWLIFLTILMSLIFDVRDIYMVMYGLKPL